MDKVGRGAKALALDAPMREIRDRLAQIEAERAAMDPADRAKLEAEELAAQRESWIRAMGPCEHGVRDFEECPDCRGNRHDR